MSRKTKPSRKRDPLPPVIKVPIPPRDVTEEVRAALHDSLKALAEARGAIESVLKRMK